MKFQRGSSVVISFQIVNVDCQIILKVGLDWLKKKLGCSTDRKRQLVEPKQATISLRRQCQLLDLSRSSWYYHRQTHSQ
jgi:hypothetical protein